MFLLAFAFAACGHGGDSGGPRIDAFALVGQLPEDKYTAIFSITFDCSDGTLGQGTASLTISGQPAVSLPIHPLLLAAGLPDDATHGAFAVPLRFSSDSASSGDTQLSAELIDGDQRTSNKAYVNLHFAY